MGRVLLTGGSGFIAAHVLDLLLERGHSVVTTVRSEQKAQKIRDAHTTYGKDKLDFAIVEDIAKPDAFDKAVISDPPFDIVLHTASPFHFNVTDTKKDLLDPAIIGTTGILKAIKKSAPSVKRVVITSSFASIINKDAPSQYEFSEKDWNPITEKGALESPSEGYRASKTFAERAAWDFVEKERPSFDLATINPPLVLGPVAHYLNSLDNLNTSNERIRDMMNGKTRDKIPPSGVHFWVDVRTVAEAHVLAAEKADASNKRFFVIAGYFSNRDIAEIIIAEFPHLKDKVASSEEALKSAENAPQDQLFRYNNTRSTEILGLEYISLKKSVVDTVNSLLEVEK